MTVGEHVATVKLDPAIERWGKMREDVYKHYKFTPKAARWAVMGMIVIPGALLWASAETDLRWNWVGKRKGESLNVAPPSS